MLQQSLRGGEDVIELRRAVFPEQVRHLNVLASLPVAHHPVQQGNGIRNLALPIQARIIEHDVDPALSLKGGTPSTQVQPGKPSVVVKNRALSLHEQRKNGSDDLFSKQKL